MKAPIPDDEEKRLKRLVSLGILDTFPEEIYDDITFLASRIAETPIALVSLVDLDRQWFKSRVGLEVQETPRDHAFCAHAINAPHELLVVNDATRDARFEDNPLVTGAPSFRFYAGAPLVCTDGTALGTLCVVDQRPRTLTELQERALTVLARQVIAQLELREALTHVKTLRGMLPICTHCKKIRDDAGFWENVETYVTEHADVVFSHGICPDCFETHYPEQLAALIEKQKQKDN